MSTTLVTVDNLVVEYPSGTNVVRPLDGFSMRAAAGQLVAVVGSSGSGKTTLLSILSAMLPATSGSVVVAGTDVSALRGRELQAYRRKTVGIVFQGFNLLPSLNALENVAAPMLATGVKRRVALRQASEVLDDVGLGQRRGHKPRELSGGQQQLVAIARALVADPVVLLADEPTANLDRASADSVVGLLQRLRARNRTVIIATHDERVLPAVDVVVKMQPDAVPQPTAAISTAGLSNVGMPNAGAPNAGALVDLATPRQPVMRF